MDRHRRIAWTLLFIFAFGCSRVPNTSGPGFGNGNLAGEDDIFADNGTFSNGSLAEGYNTLANSTDQMIDSGTFTPEQESALGDMKENLQDFAGVYSSLNPETPLEQILQIVRRLIVARQRAAQVAERLRQLGLIDLGDLMAQYGKMRPTFRFYNPQIQRHFFTESTEEGVRADKLYGFKLEGTAFYTYEAPQPNCNTALYRCYWPSNQDHFISGAANCEHPEWGIVKEATHGYVCATKQPNAPFALSRFVKTGHISTVSDKEKADLVNIHKFTREGDQGWTPW